MKTLKTFIAYLCKTALIIFLTFGLTYFIFSIFVENWNILEWSDEAREYFFHSVVFSFLIIVVGIIRDICRDICKFAFFDK